MNSGVPIPAPYVVPVVLTYQHNRDLSKKFHLWSNIVRKKPSDMSHFQ